jgi:hypothetical protein
MKKTNLIRPTKVGGTALNCFLNTHYKNFFTFVPCANHVHDIRCGDAKNPLLIFRDPIYRFNSIFNYWLFGSEMYAREQNVTDKNLLDVNHFISLIKNDLLQEFTPKYMHELHLKPQSYWYTGDYKNIIVINGNDDLKNSVIELLNYLKIPNRGFEPEMRNISIYKKNWFPEFTRESLDWFHEYFKEDFEIQQKIKSTPEVFKKVI